MPEVNAYSRRASQLEPDRFVQPIGRPRTTGLTTSRGAHHFKFKVHSLLMGQNPEVTRLGAHTGLCNGGTILASTIHTRV